MDNHSDGAPWSQEGAPHIVFRGFAKMPHMVTRAVLLSDAGFRLMAALEACAYGSPSVSAPNKTLAASSGWVKAGVPVTWKVQRTLRELESLGYIRRILVVRNGKRVRQRIDLLREAWSVAPAPHGIKETTLSIPDADAMKAVLAIRSVIHAPGKRAIDRASRKLAALFADEHSLDRYRLLFNRMARLEIPAETVVGAFLETYDHVADRDIGVPGAYFFRVVESWGVRDITDDEIRADHHGAPWLDVGAN